MKSRTDAQGAAAFTLLSIQQISRAMGWVFLALLGVQLIKSYASAALQPLDPIAMAIIEAAVLTVLFAVAGAALVGRPIRHWLEREQERVSQREDQLREAAARQQFSARLAQALSHAIDENEAKWVIQRAADQISPESTVELLLTEPGSSRLQRAFTSSANNTPGCPVIRGGICPAIRSGQARESHSGDLGACRMLVERGERCYGLCVPVTIDGQALGVLHTTCIDPPNQELKQRLQTLAEQAGIRLGLFRVMAATRQAAATDELTGLLNRRALHERAASVQGSGRSMSLVMADIDHFKRLNDTHGHQVGDRALQAFAYALSAAARPSDIVARVGGEEFIILLPDASAEGAGQVVERIRASLPRVLDSSSVPRFTASFGIADLRHGTNLEGLIKAADSALYAAKEAGRDRAFVAGERRAPEIRAVT